MAALDSSQPCRVLPPPSCRRILVVGAGGFGREVVRWALDAWPEWTTRIVGFLSDDLGRLDGFNTPYRIVGTVHDHVPEAGTAYLLAIGVAYARRTVAEHLCRQGASFVSLVHPSAVVSDSAVIGTGSIICPYAVVSESSTLGACVLVNYHASLGHDSTAGAFSVLSPYATLAGEASIGDDVFLGLHASVGPGVKVGERSKVSANSCALSSVPPDSLVYGVPGRVSPRVALDPKR
ncbi:MAG: acetyltransferase [Planctomycetes bacterium]|nr:acetyltransferase [Planctomycetota bacterium]